jgi:uncharacterized protein with GYD domain
MQGAIVMVQFSGSTDLSGLHKDLHGVENMKEVFFLAGPTDAVCHIEAADTEALLRSVLNIRGMKGVSNTDTRFIFPLH